MAIATDNVVPLTGDPRIDGLTQGSAWRFGNGPRVITYSFSLNDTPNGGPWTEVLRDAVRRAFDEWAHVANITFVEVGSGTVYNLSSADIALIPTGNELYYSSSGQVLSVGVFPSPNYANTLLAESHETRASQGNPEGDIGFDNYSSEFHYLYAGGEGFTVLLHEIGHALGLKHPFDDGGNGRPTFAALGISGNDNLLSTVMSYTLPVGQSNSRIDWANVATPMALDIIAVQQIYGANAGYHVGDDTYQIIHNVGAITTIWDAGGIDTLTNIGATSDAGVTIDLREGHVSSYVQGLTSDQWQVAIGYNVIIENAVGGRGGDTIIGNSANNLLDGGVCSDVTISDTMIGGAGDDTYVVDTPYDVIVEKPNEGIDGIISTANLTLPSNVENLTLSGTDNLTATGNDADNRLTGNSGLNILSGGAGQDILNGGPGWDSLNGGPGNDIYLLADSPEVVPDTSARLGLSYGALNYRSVDYQFFLIDQNIDGKIDAIRIQLNVAQQLGLVITSAELGRNLEVGSYLDTREAALAVPGHAGLSFNGSDTSGDFGNFFITAIDIDYSGNTPRLISLALNFEMRPDANSAPSYAGYFNYNYFGGQIIQDVVRELPNEGIDEVRVSTSYELPANVENLVLIGNSNINGLGNELANVITGNGGDNLLIGAGGADTISGNGGVDTFRYLSGNDSTIAAMDRIIDFGATDVIEFASASGLSILSGQYGWANSIGATVAAIRNDNSVQNCIVSFTNGSNEYVYVKGAGNGVNFDGSLIELAGLTSMPVIANQHPVSALAYSWKGHELLSGVVVGGSSSPIMTSVDGSIHLNGYIGAVTGLEAARAIPATEATATSEAVNLQDAIAILKMIVGLNVNADGRPLSPYQAIAADVDGNGLVSLNDAISVLRHVVGLDTSAPTWRFFQDTDATMAARANLNPGVVSPLSVDVSGNGGVGLVGVLLGDVDGSFTSPDGAPQLESLHAGYFASLAANHGINSSQFGIYPT